jgi:hypothetical protein
MIAVAAGLRVLVARNLLILERVQTGSPRWCAKRSVRIRFLGQFLYFDANEPTE